MVFDPRFSVSLANPPGFHRVDCGGFISPAAPPTLNESHHTWFIQVSRQLAGLSGRACRLFIRRWREPSSSIVTG
jgi:hypothetical protein